jgi:DNA invertase Pin-like site-specific DNA recombinase
MKGTAVLWARVSSDPQALGFSHDSQDHLLTKAAEGYELVREPYRVTESAKTSEARKQFREMIEFVITNKVQHLFAWSHDRLARHYKDFTTLQSLVTASRFTSLSPRKRSTGSHLRWIVSCFRS